MGPSRNNPLRTTQILADQLDVTQSQPSGCGCSPPSGTSQCRNLRNLFRPREQTANRDRPVIFAAGAYYKFANSARRVAPAVRILRSEALIVVVVAVDDHVRIAIVKRLPQRPHLRIIPMRAAGAE